MNDDTSSALEELEAEPSPRELATMRARAKQILGIRRLNALFSRRQWTPDDVVVEVQALEDEKKHFNRAMRRARLGERSDARFHPMAARKDIPGDCPALRTRSAK